jgi:hypothetical protein
LRKVPAPDVSEVSVTVIVRARSTEDPANMQTRKTMKAKKMRRFMGY